MVVRPLKQTGKVKKTRLNGCLMSWLEILKNRPFEVLSSLILLNNEPFPDRIVTKADCIRQQATSSSSGWTEKQLLAAYQSQTCTKKGSWSLSSGLLQVWSTTAFWILAKSFLLRSLLSKLMQYTANFNVCSWHWSTERAPIPLHNTLLHTAQPTFQKLNKLGYEVLPHLPHSLDFLTTTSSSILTTFCGKTLQPAGCRKLLSNSLLNPQTQIFKL